MSTIKNNPSNDLDTVVNATVAPFVSQYDFPVVSGIDSLYFFIVSNEAYKDFYMTLANTLAKASEANGGYIPKGSLTVKISDIDFIYLGKDMGFHFFADDAKILRVGFKDPNTNTNLQNIWVQLQSIGIYMMGMLNLVHYVTETMLRDISYQEYYINRADLNIFCQYDLGKAIKPENIVTRKQRFGKMLGSKKGYETLYIGKMPCVLRVYDKFKELKGSDKQWYMERYFKSHGLELKDPLWNLEFQLHRPFFKQYKISTLEDLFSNVEMIFHKCMDMVRLVDPSSISIKDREAERLYKATNDPIWNYLDHAYLFNGHTQKMIPLERVIYPKKSLMIKDFTYEFEKLLDKYDQGNVKITRETIFDILHSHRLMFDSKEAYDLIKPYKPILFESADRKFVLTKNFIPVATFPKKLAYMDNKELDVLEGLLLKALHQEFAMESKNKYSDTGLIVRNLSEIYQEIDRRKVGQKELELWQQ